MIRLRAAFANSIQHNLRCGVGLPGSSIANLIAAEPESTIHLTHRFLDRRGQEFQHAITFGMSGEIIDVLEAIEVDADDAQWLARAPAARTIRLNGCNEGASIVKPGEGVGDREPVQLGLGLAHLVDQCSHHDADGKFSHP